MFTFTDKKVGSLLTDEKCFNDLYDLYKNRKFKNKLVLVLENRIAYELPLKIISVKWAVACAERCLHFFEEKIPDDNRPRKAIEAAQQWIIDQTNATANAARIAYAAVYATQAAHASRADVTAYYAADAAADAARATANAANAASNAAASAYYAANAAANAANAANADSTDLSEQKWSRNKLKEIVGEYLNDYRSDLKNTLIVLGLTRVRVHIIPELSDIIIKYVV